MESTSVPSRWCVCRSTMLEDVRAAGRKEYLRERSFGPPPDPAAPILDEGERRRQRLMQPSSVPRVGQHENDAGQQDGR